MKWKWIAIGAMLVIAGTAHAESLYVNGVIQPRLRTGPGLNFETIERLPNGTVVQASAEKNGFTYIQLPNGRDGWVESYYLNKDLPSQALVESLKTENERMKEELVAARKRAEELAAANAALIEDRDKTRAALSEAASGRKPAGPLPVASPAPPTGETPSRTAPRETSAGLSPSDDPAAHLSHFMAAGAVFLLGIGIGGVADRRFRKTVHY